MKAIQKIALVGHDKVQVTLFDETLPVEVHQTTLEELPYFLIELAAVNNGIDATATSSITHDSAVVNSVQGIKTALAGVGLDATSAGVFATTFDGDSKDEVTAMSDSALNAIAKLLTAGGFKSKAFDGGVLFNGNLTCVAWMEAYRYGFKRASDEKLKEELEGILQPEIGAW